MINNLILITKVSDTDNYLEILANISSILHQSDKLIVVVENKLSEDSSDETKFMANLKYTIRRGRLEHLYVYSLRHLYSSKSAVREFLILCRRSGVVVHSYLEEWLPAVMSLPESVFATQITKRLLGIDYLEGVLPRKARTKTGFTVGK
jgi:hypothetical protein